MSVTVVKLDHAEFLGRRSPLFWEAPDAASAAHAWPTPRPIPDGWSETFSGPWRHIYPVRSALPSQGWKIHVSATLANADDVLGHVWETCISAGVAFKYIPDRDTFRSVNAKYASRASSGKFVAIYPADERALEGIADELCARLKGFDGPYILSDLRLGDAPVFVRYGGFVERRRLRPDGQPEHVIVRPDGTFEADVRAPSFQPPAWAPLPALVARAIDRSDDDQPMPVTITEALHFSNGGGVYAARTAEGVSCIVKEARPHAGLDGHDDDAITRVRRERDVLRALVDVEEVPTVLDAFAVWEHEFVVLERREGMSLDVWLASEGAMLLAGQTPDVLADYAERAFAISRRVAAIVERIHACGFSHNDLQPRNVLVDEHGGVTLLDFETAATFDERLGGRLATPGFRAPSHLRGADVDRWALEMMKLWMFCPLHSLVDLTPTKIEQMAAFGRALVPTEHAAELDAAAAWLVEHRAPSGLAGPSPLPSSAARTNPAAFRASLIACIDAYATPDDAHRLVPGDAEQYDDQATTLAHGASGVLYALDAVGQRRPEYEDWLLRQVATKPPLRVGAFDGRYGIAYVLGLLGHHDAAVALAEGARRDAAVVENPDFYSGLAGMALCSLSLAHETGLGAFFDDGLRWGERLASRLDALPADGRDPDLAAFPGLANGWSGPAVLFHTLWHATRDDAWLTLASRAVKQDLARCEERDGSVFVRDDINRRICYLAVGSAGVAVAVARVLNDTSEPDLAEALPRLLRACAPPFVLLAGLLNGRAGLAATLAHAGRDDPRARAAADEHLERWSLHTVGMGAGIAVPGGELQRLSMDLASGSAGVLLASAVVEDPSIAPLPLLDTLRKPVGAASGPTTRAREEVSA